MSNELLSTTDAMVWAQEFCNMFHGYMVMKDGTPQSPMLTVDEGLMVGWFANAIMTGYHEGSQKFCPHTDQFELAVDLLCCRACGKLT